MVKTLRDCVYKDYQDGCTMGAAYKYLDTEVVGVAFFHYMKTGEVYPWPNFTHRHITGYYVLANGLAVGFNENPALGISFPVKRIPKNPMFFKMVLPDGDMPVDQEEGWGDAMISTKEKIKEQIERLNKKGFKIEPSGPYADLFNE